MLLFLLSWLRASYGFDVPVHAQITGAAFSGCSGFGNYFADNNISAEKLYTGVLDWNPDFDFPEIGVTASELVVDGSIWEDGSGIDAGGSRSLNHFYDPTTKQGLSIVAGVVSGLPSKTWASISNAVNPGLIGGGFNQYAWQNARAYQSNSIVSYSSSDRDQQAAFMFRSIGQVVHLLEDTAQPQHARNEQHLDKFPFTPLNTPWRSAFEDWGRDHLTNIVFTPADLDWQAAGFTCVSNFWDTGLYVPSVTGTAPLTANENGGPTLGLAEFCNGNFLTVRGSYGEYPQLANAGGQVYTYPSIYSTDFSHFQGDPAAYCKLVAIFEGTLDPDKAAYRCVVSKTSQGVSLTNHCAIDLLATYRPNAFGAFPGVLSAVHPDDPDVISNYYSVLVPRAIAYSAGLIDYYFRGRLEITDCTISNQTCLFTAMNISPQNMNGGAFTIFTDDVSGNRTQAPGFSTSYSSNKTLAPGASITGTFTVTNGLDPDFVLAYFGPIGVAANGQPLDAIDSNACASIQFPNPSPTTLQLRGVGAVLVGGGDINNMVKWIQDYPIYEVAWGALFTGNFTDPSQTTPPTTSSGPIGGALTGSQNELNYLDNEQGPPCTIYPSPDPVAYRVQALLPLPTAYYIIAWGGPMDASLSAECGQPVFWVAKGCIVPQQADDRYPMIVDLPIPNDTLDDAIQVQNYYIGIITPGAGYSSMNGPALAVQQDLTGCTAASLNMNGLGPNWNPSAIGSLSTYPSWVDPFTDSDDEP
jgi:hypothetical protein